MPTTMTRLPGDPYLGFPPLASESSSSTVMSPLSLPRGVSGYFDYTATGRANRDHLPAMTAAHRIPGPPHSSNFLNSSYPAVYSPLSPGVRGPPVPQPSQFLSPHLTPISQEVQNQIQQHHQQRSVSASPTRKMAAKASSTMGRSRSNVTSPSRPTPATTFIPPPALNGIPSSPYDALLNGAIPSISGASAGHPRSVSADATSGPSQVLMIRRLVQQNGRIREAWEAERKYMEANRERVEEVYKEERALMEEERAEWESERDVLMKKIMLLQQQVATLCGYTGSPKYDVSAKAKSQHGANGGWNMSPESMRSSASSQGNSNQVQRNGGFVGSGESMQRAPPAQLQAVSDAASLAPLQTNFGLHPPSRFGPPKQPESSSFIPITTNNEMASPPKDDVVPVPTVDVQEIIPTSEGIPIKASAIQKTTFSDGPYSPPDSKPSSRTPSPPADPSKLGLPRKPSSVQTLQVLAADETSRLTMHAGHTPNHSLSVLPTVTATTASSSGEATPTLQLGDFADSSVATSSYEPLEPTTTRKSETGVDDVSYPEEAGLDAGPEDAPLRGPLMVRNMPAHDEIFFRRLSDKLEEVSKGAEASVPAVLRDVVEPENVPDRKQENGNHRLSGGDDVTADKADNDKESPTSSDGEEIEVPLKLKRSNNFGAPFGEFR